jgi:hypothetical protein
MKRVEANGDWTLFCPNEAPGLSDCYGEEYEKLYIKYENEGRFKKQIDAIELWNKIYEKLFGGFEDLTLTCVEDDEEDDELENIPKHMKTKKGGYLKDGFVVDSSDTEEIIGSDTEDEDDNLDESSDETSEVDDDAILEEIGSELSEEAYDYSDSEK